MIYRLQRLKNILFALRITFQNDYGKFAPFSPKVQILPQIAQIRHLLKSYKTVTIVTVYFFSKESISSLIGAERLIFSPETGSVNSSSPQWRA